MAEKKEWSYEDYKDGEATTGFDTKRGQYAQAIDNLGDFKYDTYNPSDAVNNYQSQFQNHEANKVGDWTGGTYGTALNELLNKINNREKFSYDLNGDALYQQYKDQYMTQGKMAMMDTMGQAAAATGGYGNSYAQSVGQQTYQGYLQQLNDRVPELYQMALSKYNMEGDQLLNQYNVTSDAYNREYGQHRDSVADWENTWNRLYTAYNNERNWDYGQFSDAQQHKLNEYELAYGKLQDALNRADTNYWNSRNFDYGKYSDDRNLSYGQHRDEIADEQWKKNYDLAVDQFEANKAQSGVTKDTTTGKYVAPQAVKPYGEFTASQFTSAMREAAMDGDEKYAKSIVAAAGYSEEAMAIYDMYFGSKKTGKQDTTVTTADKKLTLMEKRMGHMK